MRLYTTVRDVLWDNIHFLFEADDEEIIHSLLKVADAKINLPTEELVAWLAEDHIRWWQDRYDYGAQDMVEDEGTLLYAENIKEIFDRTVSEVMSVVQTFDRQSNFLQDMHPGETIGLCQTCRTLHLKKDIVDLTDREELRVNYICAACYRDRFSKCEICGVERSKNSLIRLMTGEPNIAEKRLIHICYDCSADHVQQCTSCRCNRLKTDIVTRVVNMDITATLCIYCFHNIMRECQECETQFPVVHRIVNYPGEGEYCDACLYDRQPYHSYQYKPYEFYYKTNKAEIRQPDTMFYGLELECELEVGRDKEAYALGVKGRYTHKDLYIVHDGSLNHGIEVVLMPFSEIWLKSHKTWIKSLYQHMKDCGGDFNGEKVGLHVHTSKAAWAPSQLYKLMRFCYAPQHAGRLERFYGRGPCTHALKNDDEYSEAASVAISGKNADDTHHYNMINMSTGKTVEFRMFRGTNSVDRMFSYLDFIRALWGFTRNFGMQSMKMDNFAAYVNKYNKYKALQPYFKVKESM